MIDVLASPRFGAGEIGTAWLGAGWAAPEPGFVWSVGAESAIDVPLPRGTVPLALEIAGAPFRAPPAMRYQRIRVVVNGVVVADRRLGGDIVWWIDLPAAACVGESLHIVLVRGSGAVRPDAPLADQRDLGFRLQALTLLRIRREPPPPPLRPVTTLRFGVNEMTEGWLGAGFGAPEDGYAWALGRTSELTVPVDAAGGKMLVLLDMRPAVEAGGRMRQRVAISVDGRFGSFYDLRTRQVIAVEVNPAPGQRIVTLRFDNIDARPADADAEDGRPFAWALASVHVAQAPPEMAPAALAPYAAGSGDPDAMARAVTGLDAAALLGCFESLGNLCDIGQLQHRFGYTRPSLLRYAGIPQCALIDGLAEDFCQLGRADHLTWGRLNPGDATWRLVSQAYSMHLATNYRMAEPVTARLMQSAAKMLAWLAEKFLTEARDERIFVFRASSGMCCGPVGLAVLAMLRRRSDATLLCLQSDATSPPGTVARLATGVMLGQLGPQDEPKALDDALLTGILAQTLRLHRAAASDAAGGPWPA